MSHETPGRTGGFAGSAGDRRRGPVSGGHTVDTAAGRGKLESGAAVRPGQLQLLHAGKMPLEFAAHPTHDVRSFENASGGEHVSTEQSEKDNGKLRVRGAKPLGHVYPPTRQDDCVESGYEPSGHVLQEVEPAAA